MLEITPVGQFKKDFKTCKNVFMIWIYYNRL